MFPRSASGVPNALTALVWSFTRALSIQAMANLPYVYTPTLEAMVQTFGSALFPIALTLQLPVYVYVAVMEKELKLR